MKFVNGLEVNEANVWHELAHLRIPQLEKRRVSDRMVADSEFVSRIFFFLSLGKTLNAYFLLGPLWWPSLTKKGALRNYVVAVRQTWNACFAYMN